MSEVVSIKDARYEKLLSLSPSEVATLSEKDKSLWLALKLKQSFGFGWRTDIDDPALLQLNFDLE